MDFALLLLFVPMSMASKILFLPFFWPSHVREALRMAEEVTKLGHDTVIALPSPPVQFSYVKSAKDSGIGVINYHRSDETLMARIAEINVLKAFKNRVGSLENTRQFSKMLINDCDNLLSNNTFIGKLRDEKFDLIVIDGLSICRCYVILPHLLKVPFVSFSGYFEPYLSGVPAIPSVVPVHVLALAPKMSFLERARNVLEHIRFYSLDFPIDGQWLIKKHLPGSQTTFRQLMSDSQFWLFTTISPYVGPALPTMPNTTMIGGLSTAPAKSLSGEFELFCNEADDGVIVMSLVWNIPTAFFYKFFEAFKRIKQRVVVRVPSTSDIGIISDNVKPMDWIPQNDLLGHPNTVLFITHGGSSGLHEAIYHGVPMLMGPLMPSDQQYNVKQIEYKGFGLALDLLTCNSDDIVESINRILNNSSYSERIKKASAAFRSDPYPPAKKAANWISFTSIHGGGHFRPPCLDMPIWEYFMLDIVGFVLVMFFVPLVLLYIAIRSMFRGTMITRGNITSVIAVEKKIK